MGNKKNQNKPSNKMTLNIELNYLMADEYMRMANGMIKKVPKLNKNDKQESLERSASENIALSLLAFAIELHFKSIYYMEKKETLTGHRLFADLWDNLPKPVQTWLSEAFDKNFDSESHGWVFSVSFSPPFFSSSSSNPQLKDSNKSPAVRMHKNNALGMIKGHQDAFKKGRYAYELPLAPKLKPILYNLEGLQLLACLTQKLASHLHKKFVLEKKTGETKDLNEHMSEIPKSIKKFPHK